MKSHSESYRAAGVDVTAGYRAVELMREHVASTHTSGVLSGIGSFGGLFMPDLSGMEQPVLVSGTDGVGTKLKLAFLMDKHDTIGIDCVAMSVNDIVCQGAKPLFFLDYLAMGKNRPELVRDIVAGVCDGCRQAGCALIGGETAEMPGFYPEDEYDLAGFAVGIVDKKRIVDGSAVREGDAILALPSSGVHSNGFSLVRKVLRLSADNIRLPVPELATTLGEELLKPTRVYVKPMLKLMEALPVHGICHITGGGFYENAPRMLPPGLMAKIERARLSIPPIFGVIAQQGAIPERDMFNTFNMGVGMMCCVAKEDAARALEILRGEGELAYICGEVAKGDEGVVLC